MVFLLKHASINPDLVCGIMSGYNQIYSISCGKALWRFLYWYLFYVNVDYNLGI